MRCRLPLNKFYLDKNLGLCNPSGSLGQPAGSQIGMFVTQYTDMLPECPAAGPWSRAGEQCLQCLRGAWAHETGHQMPQL